jgi:hypothetical protein
MSAFVLRTNEDVARKQEMLQSLSQDSIAIRCVRSLSEE